MFATAYLHDMAAFKPWKNSKLEHGHVAATKIDSVLNGTGFPMAKRDTVRGAIATHMDDQNPVRVEAIYLHDADALDWLGVIGIARLFAPVDPDGGNPIGPNPCQVGREPSQSGSRRDDQPDRTRSNCPESGGHQRISSAIVRRIGRSRDRSRRHGPKEFRRCSTYST
jgi:hypothetical protein